jgi:linoleoyl-CoA desaturase
MATLFWVFGKDYKYFLQRDLGPYPPFEWQFLLISKASYYFATIVVPLLVLDITWWQFLIGFLTLAPDRRADPRPDFPAGACR